jgi:hypothetical protein
MTHYPISVMPPGYIQFSTLQSPVALDDMDVFIAKTVIGAVVSTVVFEYEDRSGHLYRSTYCGYRTLGGAIADCPERENNII